MKDSRPPSSLNAQAVAAGSDHLDAAPTTHESLEARVLARTKELREANSKLRAEIAQRIEAEENLRRQADLLDQVHDAVISIDLHGIVQSWNKGAERVYGYTADEMIGQHVSLLRSPHDRPQHYDTTIRPILERGHHAGVFRNRRKTGEEIFIDLRLTLVHDDDGNPIGIVGCSNDITQHKRAQDLLEYEHRRAQQYLDIVGVMVVALDKDGRVTLINRKGCQILESREDELLGKDWFDFAIPERLHDDVRDVFNKIMEGRVSTVEYYENPIVTASGEERIIEWHNSEIRSEDGNVIGVLSSGMDVTERKRNAEQVRRLQEEVVDAAEYEQGRIGRELHDDAGQALRGLAFSANALHEKLRAEGLDDRANDARHFASGLEETLRKVRALARGLVRVEFDTGEFQDALRRIAQETEEHFGIPCRVLVAGKGALPGAGAALQLYRIAQEAVANAVHHGAPRSVRIRLNRAPDSVTLTVRDDGRGFSFDKSANEGLGLRIMRHRAELIGADLTIDSDVGRGTAVTCVLQSAR